MAEYLDDVPQLHIAALRELDMINPGELNSVTITLRERRYNQIKVNTYVNLMDHNSYVELIYNHWNHQRKYKVQLTCIESNIGSGVIWYFICPKTNKRCRILYFIDGYFYHRDAFPGYLYESQIKKTGLAAMAKSLCGLSKSEQEVKSFYSKYRKKYYAGKPTKLFIKIMKIKKEIKQVGQIV